jgi:D-glycero-D-manno-heptose 1,7-bisphosphate phosphatase
MMFKAARVAVFLDRDGVLNDVKLRNGRPLPPRHVGELTIVEGARSALDALKDHGFELIVVTNQPDIARGEARRADVDLINARLAEALPVDAIEVCPHDDCDFCDCRKPKPGLLLRAGERFRLDVARSFIVGDRWRDIEAGRRAGCRTILVGNGYGERFISPPTITVASLPAAAAWIIQQSRSEGSNENAH